MESLRVFLGDGNVMIQQTSAGFHCWQTYGQHWATLRRFLFQMLRMGIPFPLKGDVASCTQVFPQASTFIASTQLNTLDGSSSSTRGTDWLKNRAKRQPSTALSESQADAPALHTQHPISQPQPPAPISQLSTAHRSTVCPKLTLGPVRCGGQNRERSQRWCWYSKIHLGSFG